MVDEQALRALEAAERAAGSAGGGSGSVGHRSGSRRRNEINLPDDDMITGAEEEERISGCVCEALLFCILCRVLTLPHARSCGVAAAAFRSPAAATAACTRRTMRSSRRALAPSLACSICAR
jgi:hypothetical protein